MWKPNFESWRRLALFLLLGIFCSLSPAYSQQPAALVVEGGTLIDGNGGAPCPASQRLHMSVFCFAESFTRLPCVINTTFREKIYIRWCCIDRLSPHRLSGIIFFSVT
jgi:hypothetical protein